MPLIYNDQTPDIKIKIYGKAYHLHKEVLEKSNFFKALISDKWSKGETITIECKDLQEEKCILRVIDHMYGHLYDFDGIAEPEMLKVIEAADYLGDSELVKEYSSEKVAYIDTDTMNEIVPLAFKLYDKNKTLYDACVNVIANNIIEYKTLLFDQEANLKILYDVAHRPNLWFKTEYERYKFARKIARKFGIKDPKIAMGEYKETKIDARTTVEKWFSTINYYQLNSEEIEEAIIDGYLTIEDFRKILPMKKRYLSDENMLLSGRICIEINLNSLDSVVVKCGLHMFTIRLLKDEKGYKKIGVYLRYQGTYNEIRIDYELILPPCIRTGSLTTRERTLTLKRGEELGHKDEINYTHTTFAERNNDPLRLTININRIMVVG